MVVMSVHDAQFRFHIHPDGVWMEVEAPSGRRATINLAEIAAASEVGEVFREWSDWHVGRTLAVEP
jgi:hypothetical protein